MTLLGGSDRPAVRIPGRPVAERGRFSRGVGCTYVSQHTGAGAQALTLGSTQRGEKGLTKPAH